MSDCPTSSKTMPHAITAAGRLFYVVGPSGVGKDALLHWVRERLAPQDGARLAGTVFAQRVITRPPHPSEAHEAVDAEQFRALADADQFSLRWQANGTAYGIRRGIEADLAAGRDVVVNGSREHVPQLRQSFPEAIVVWISADPDTIARRLTARQRESGTALQQRVERGARFAAPADARTIHIDNSGPLEVAGERLLGLLGWRVAH